MTAYYNENNPHAAATLRELIRDGLIAPGDVDERSIEDVTPAELVGYTQRHFFAGAGIWSLALRNAGWEDSREVVTGSCPCQPFSVAGKGKGMADERHLWPAFYWHIALGRPCAVFGEQVASDDGLGWLDIVSADLEASDYAIGAVDTCAAGFGAFHIRQRLYWVAYPNGMGRGGRRAGSAVSQPGPIERSWGRGDASWLAHADGEQEYSAATRRLHDHVGGGSGAGGVGNASLDRWGSGRVTQASVRHSSTVGGEDWERPDSSGTAGGLGYTRCERDELRRGLGDVGRETGQEQSQAPQRQRCRDANSDAGADGRPGATDGIWRDVDWLLCRDGKWRPTQSGLFPLAHGYPGRVGLLRLAGNAIVAPQAEAFVRAAMEVIEQ